MRHCPNCGQYVRDNAAYCPGCGSHLATGLYPHALHALAKSMRIVFLIFTCLALLVNIGIISLVLFGFFSPISIFLSICLSLIIIGWLGAMELRILGVILEDETITDAKFLTLMLKTFSRLPLLLRPLPKLG